MTADSLGVTPGGVPLADTNLVHIVETTGCQSASAVRLCEQLGIDPAGRWEQARRHVRAMRGTIAAVIAPMMGDEFTVATAVAKAKPVPVGWSSDGRHPMSSSAPLDDHQLANLLSAGVLRTDAEVAAADARELA